MKNLVWVIWTRKSPTQPRRSVLFIEGNIPLLLGTDEEKLSLNRKRAHLRLLTELLLTGASSDFAPLSAAVRSLACPDFRRERESAQAAITLLAGLAKSSREEVLGIPPKALVSPPQVS